jgi:hypothetical protein
MILTIRLGSSVEAKVKSVSAESGVFHDPDERLRSQKSYLTEFNLFIVWIFGLLEDCQRLFT